MKAKLATPAGAFLFLSIAAFVYFLLTVVRSIRGEAMAAREFTDGVGIEIIGALITSLGIIGLEQLYSKPDAEISALRTEIVQQNAKLDAIQAELRTMTAKLQASEDDDLD
jgi:uncharacterized coiled-coil protein SlyX